MFTVERPTDWRDLQQNVALILSVSGFKVEIQKKLDGARGTVEVDVYGEEEVAGRKYVVVCECKHWKAKIPQTVIHGFRTILGDLGANLGYIITTSDFQSGSFAASRSSNVKLLTWENFQIEFEASWYPKVIDQVNNQLVGGMLSFSGEHTAGSRGYLPEPDKTEAYRIGSEYLEFYCAMKSVLQTLTWHSKLTLPIRANISDIDKDEIAKIPDSVLDAPGFLELIREVTSINDAAFAKAYEVHARNKHLKTEAVHGFIALPWAARQLRFKGTSN